MDNKKILDRIENVESLVKAILIEVEQFKKELTRRKKKRLPKNKDIITKRMKTALKVN